MRLVARNSLIAEFLAIICASAILLTCSSCSREPRAPEKAPAAATSKVTVRLQWFHLAQFAGFYAAQDEGFYRNHGLDVDLRPGGPDLNAITLVGSGSDDFGVWTADHILISQSKGVPIVVLAAIYRDDPNVLMVKEESPIKTPQDFVGKTVSTVFGRSTETVLNALLANAGVAKSSVNIVPFPFNIQSFLDGQVDVSAGYVYDHPYQAETKHQAIRLIRPSEYGIKFYSDCIFARRDFIAKHPDLVQNFVSATLEGWEFALREQSKAVESTLKRGTGLDRASQAYMLQHAEPLIRAENSKEIGLVRPESVEAMTVELKRQGLLDTGFVSSTSFNNQFVQTHYSEAR